MSKAIVEMTKLHKDFEVGEMKIPVLKGVDMTVDPKDFIIIFGPSGCGKSTLLHVMLGLETPTQGKVNLFGSDLYQGTSEDERTDMRKRYVGMVYQQPNWIKALTVVENVAFPLVLNGVAAAEAETRARKMLAQVAMEAWADYAPMQLSSGQQQRVALARALILEPKLIIADEPTGNLDHEAGQEMMALLQELNRKHEKTIVMVTHDLQYVTYAKKALRMLDGLIVEQLDPDQFQGLKDMVYKPKQAEANEAVV